MFLSSHYLTASVLAAIAISQTSETFEASARGERINATIEAQRKKEAIPGLSVAIAIDGSVVWSDGFGMSDLENAVPATPKTVYRIASI